MNQFLVYALIAGFLWGLWPIVLKTSGLQGSWPTIVLSIGALMFVSCVTRELPMPSWKGLLIGLSGGLMAGLATFLFTKITSSNDAKASISSLYSICLMMELAFGFLGACYFFGEEITTRKVLGCIAAGIAMWLFA